MSDAASDDSAVIGPGGRVGILGAGQLGRMLAMAAARMGLRAHLYDPAFDPPAGHVAPTRQADWSDDAALRAFAKSVDVVTFEFENVPLSALATVAEIAPVRPAASVLSIARDRYEEKTFLNAIGIETARFAPVETVEHLTDALQYFDGPAILKTRRLGYDGKGQVRIAGLEDAGTALASVKGQRLIVEAVVPFEREISVIVARGLDGSVRSYDPIENVHEDGILRRSMVPAAIRTETAERAAAIAGQIVTALGHVGVMGVEMFHTEDDRLLVNEIAPRVHNTGHLTSQTCAVDQFEQHLRAICGWPLGETARHCDAVMDNLIGEDVAEWARWAGEPGAALHLYGKGETRPGRKMGHVTRIRDLT